MRQNRRLAAVPVAAVAGAVGATLLFGGPSTPKVTAQDTAQMTQEQRAAATSLEGAFMTVAETVQPATVSITAQIEPAAPRPQIQVPGDDEEDSPFGDLFGPFRRGLPPGAGPRSGRASGSGVIVRQDGYILTNDHVIAGARDGMVKVTLSDGRELRGKVFRDQRSDLAVIKVDTVKPLPFVRLADSDRLRVGQWAVAIGSPFGQAGTMTAGIVSALHRKSEIGLGTSERYYPNLIQTDASINPGNSGGPLLNIHGELIGVNVAIYSPSGANAGIGFAIPANTARVVMDQLISRGKVVRGYLGIQPEDIPVAHRERLGSETGARVRSVGTDSPAGQAGVQADDVITRFGSRDIRGEVDLRDAIAATAPGSRVSLTLLRDRKPSAVEVTVGSVPEEQAAAAVAPPAASRPASRLGIRGQTLTAEIARELKLDAGARGVVVAGLQPGSPVAEAGLRPRDIVTAANNSAVTTVEALNAAVGAARSGDVITLRVLRNTAPGQKPTQVVVDVNIP